MPSSSTVLKNHTIVFDLDGTLVDTAPDLQIALNHTLSRFGFDTVPPEAAASLIGHGAKAMIRAGISHQSRSACDETIDDMFDVFLEYYVNNIAIRSKAFPGCIAALERLAGAGAILAVCTNKRQNLAYTLLEELGMSDFFAAIVGADSVTHRKPAADHILQTLKRAEVSAQNAIMVGDSETDEKAALNAGLPFVFVPFGYGPAGKNTLAQATILHHYEEMTLPFILETLSA